MRPHCNNTRAPIAIAASPRSGAMRQGLDASQNKRAGGFRVRCFVLSLSATIGIWGVVSPARAARQPGAPRLLRFSWSDPLARRDAQARRALTAPASVSQAAFSPPSSIAPSEIFFTRASANTSNLWRAALDAPSGNATSGDATSGDGATDDAARSSANLSLDAEGPEVQRRSDDVSRRLSERGKVLRARPLTRFKAPFFATNACPTPDGRAVLCVTNALGLDGSENLGQVDPARQRIARLDLESGRLTPLSAADTNSYAPSVAPDGTRFAFVSDRFGAGQVFVAAMDGGDARRVDTLVSRPSRRPFWLDNETLVVESTRRAQTALYRFALPQRLIDSRPNGTRASSNPVVVPGVGQGGPSSAALLFKRGGQGASAPNGRQLCIATDPGGDYPVGGDSPRDINSARMMDGRQGARLYFLAGDGSTVSTVPSTEGARHPVFSPDGSALLYDAPLFSDDIGAVSDDSENSSPTSAAKARGLWLLPMLRVAPVSQLLRVRASASKSYAPGTARVGAVEELEIVGTAFAAGDDAPQVQLQWGEGEDPSRWNALPLRHVPAQATTLATWRPPANSRGPWTLRLTVVDSDGDKAESILPVSRPFPTPVTTPDLLTSNAAPSRATSDAIAPGTAPEPFTSSSRVPSSAALNPSSRARSARSRDAASTSSQANASSPVNASRSRRERARNREQSPVVASSQAAARTVAALPPPSPLTPDSSPEKNDTNDSDSISAGEIDHNARGRDARQRSAMNQNNGKQRDVDEAAEDPGEISPDDRLLAPFSIPPGGGPLPAPDANRRTSERAAVPAKNKAGALRDKPDAPIASDAARDDKPSRDERNRDERNRDVADDVQNRADASGAKRGGQARIVVVGTPRETTPEREIALTARLSNRGQSVWSSESARPIRLLVRWQDVATRRRARWEIKWLRDDVRPGQTIALPFFVSAPPRPGNYTLSVSLLRLNGSSYQPPPADSRAKNNASTLPSELASVSFPVTVR